MIKSILLKETPEYTIRHYTGHTEFSGCQCFKDCTCHEDFLSEPVDYYTLSINNLTSKRPKSKTIRYNTLDEIVNYITNK